MLEARAVAGADGENCKENVLGTCCARYEVLQNTAEGFEVLGNVFVSQIIGRCHWHGHGAIEKA